MNPIQGRAGTGEVVATMIRLPRSLRDTIRDQARGLGRSLNTHVVMVLSEATKTAAGERFGDCAPAAESEDAAFGARRRLTTQASGEPR